MGSDCASILIPLLRSHGLCVFILIITNAMRSLQKGCSCKLCTKCEGQSAKVNAIYNLQSTLYNVQCTIYIVQCAIDNLQSTLCNVRSTIYNPHCAKCDRQSTIHDVQEQSRHRKWTSDDCRAIVLVEALHATGFRLCITSKTPVQEPLALCIYFTNAVRSLQRGCRKAAAGHGFRL